MVAGSVSAPNGKTEGSKEESTQAIDGGTHSPTKVQDGGGVVDASSKEGASSSNNVSAVSAVHSMAVVGATGSGSGGGDAPTATTVANSDDCPASPATQPQIYQHATYLPHLTPGSTGYYLYPNNLHSQVTPEPPSPATGNPVGYDISSFLQQQATIGVHNPFGAGAAAAAAVTGAPAAYPTSLPQPPLSPGSRGGIPPPSPLFPRATSSVAAAVGGGTATAPGGVVVERRADATTSSGNVVAATAAASPSTRMPAPPSPSPYGFASPQLGTTAPTFSTVYPGYGAGGSTYVGLNGNDSFNNDTSWSDRTGQPSTFANMGHGLPMMYGRNDRSQSFDEMLPPAVLGQHAQQPQSQQEKNQSQTPQQQHQQQHQQQQNQPEPPFSPYAGSQGGTLGTVPSSPMYTQQVWGPSPYGTSPGDIYGGQASPMQPNRVGVTPYSPNPYHHSAPPLTAGGGPPPMGIATAAAAGYPGVGIRSLYGNTATGPPPPHHHSYYPATSPGPPIQTTASNKGPDGANLFIFHIPNHFTNTDMYNLFCRYGNLLSVRIMVEKETGRSRGFGFVSYDNPESAAMAIKELNGYAIGNKRLKVQHKQIRAERGGGGAYGSPTAVPYGPPPPHHDQASHHLHQHQSHQHHHGGGGGGGSGGVGSSSNTAAAPGGLETSPWYDVTTTNAKPPIGGGSDGGPTATSSASSSDYGVGGGAVVAATVSSGGTSQPPLPPTGLPSVPNLTSSTAAGGAAELPSSAANATANSGTATTSTGGGDGGGGTTVVVSAATAAADHHSPLTASLDPLRSALPDVAPQGTTVE